MQAAGSAADGVGGSGVMPQGLRAKPLAPPQVGGGARPPPRAGEAGGSGPGSSHGDGPPAPKRARGDASAAAADERPCRGVKWLPDVGKWQVMIALRESEKEIYGWNSISNGRFAELEAAGRRANE
jgi:hypothetical protein